jgi:hypothetical protein
LRLAPDRAPVVQVPLPRSPKSQLYSMLWKGFDVIGDVVPDASKKTANGATPEIRLGTTETAGGLGTLVVKLHVKSVPRAMPDESFAAAAMVALYCVFAARAAEGVNVAVLPKTITVPVTGTPPAVVARVKPEVISVASFIVLEKVATTTMSGAMPVAAIAGDVLVTVGGVEF